jgi:site-specific recombinase XerC
MNELTVVDKATDWRRMKGLVLDSVRSPITKRVYAMALDEFFDWYRLEPRLGFAKATVNAWRVSLDERGLGSSSIIVRMSAIRKLAMEATDNGLLAPELAAGIQAKPEYRTQLSSAMFVQTFVQVPFGNPL